MARDAVGCALRTLRVCDLFVILRGLTNLRLPAQPLWLFPGCWGKELAGECENKAY